MLLQHGFQLIVNFRAQLAFDEYFMGDANTHWDFLPKFLSLHYYTTLHTALRGGQMSKLKIGFYSP